MLILSGAKALSNFIYKPYTIPKSSSLYTNAIRPPKGHIYIPGTL
jgi:hypothetical protein